MALVRKRTRKGRNGIEIGHSDFEALISLIEMLPDGEKS